MTIQSQPFRIARNQYARAATKYYMRRYAVHYGLAIVLGIILIAFFRDTFALWLGIILVIYPLTVPIRYANVISARAMPFLEREMSYTVHPSHVEVRNELGGVTTAQFANARDVEVIDGMIVLLYGRSNFLILPLDPLDDAERNDFVRWARQRGAIAAASE